MMRGTLHTDISLAKYNTWWVGGMAKRLYIPADSDDLSTFLKTLAPNDEPIWLGLGSNVLIADEGVNNTIIVTQGGLDEITLLKPNYFRAEAGVTCAKAAKFCVKNNLLQGEFFAGIPGTVGGALAMNAGAFGGETWTYVKGVDTIDKQGVIRHRLPSEYVIKYRSVMGPGISEGGREWFIAGYFELPEGDGTITAEKIKSLLKKRGETQPIGLPSCGSVFKNPTGYYAAQLIESCDLKGYQIGGAEVSTKHANFIINTGNATAKNIADLIVHIQSTVREKTGILLETEVRFIGWEQA